MDPALPDHYAVLQVTPAATADEIRAAHRERLKENHPDITRGLLARYQNSDDPVLLKILKQKASGAHAATQQINTAYEVLSDPTQRARYDRQRQAPPVAQPPPPQSPPPRAQPTSHTTFVFPSPTAAELQRLEEERLITQILALCIHGRYQAALALAEHIATPDRRRRIRAYVQELQPARAAPTPPLAAAATACPRCDGPLGPARAARFLSQEVAPLLRRSGLEWAIGAASLPIACLLLVALCTLCGGAMLAPLNTTLPQAPPPVVRGRPAAAPPVATHTAVFSGLVPASLICLLGTGACLILLNQLPPLRATRQQRRHLRQVWARTRHCPHCGLVFVGGSGRGVPPPEVLHTLESAWPD